MRWRSHTRIARAVADVLGIHGAEREALARGSIEPDKTPDYEYRVGRRGKIYTARAPHHKISTKIIMRNLYDARRYHLRGNRTAAMRCLGRAMHYLHDRVTGKGFLGLFHDRVEEKVKNTGVDYYSIKKGAEDSIPLPTEIERAINAFAVRSNRPEEIMRRACYISGYVAKAVLAPAVNRELVDEYHRLRERHNKKVIPISFGIAGAVAIIAYALTMNIAGLLALSLAPLIAALDRGYARCKKNIEWYSL